MSDFDPDDYAERIAALYPTIWGSKGASSPGGNLYAVFKGAGGNFAFHKQVQLDYTRLQSRLLTATDTNLDTISSDFLTDKLPRGPFEPDDSFRQRIQSFILAPRSTIPAITLLVLALYTPISQFINPNTLGFDFLGGLEVSGFLDTSVFTGIIPDVYVYDRMWDPTEAALNHISEPVFVIRLTFHLPHTRAKFLGRSYLHRNNCYLFTDFSGTLFSTAPDPALGALVHDIKAEGTIPMYSIRRFLI